MVTPNNVQRLFKGSDVLNHEMWSEILRFASIILGVLLDDAQIEILLPETRGSESFYVVITPNWMKFGRGSHEHTDYERRITGSNVLPHYDMVVLHRALPDILAVVMERYPGARRKL